MDRRRFVRTGRALLILSLAAAMWAVAVALTGGFVLEAGHFACHRTARGRRPPSRSAPALPGFS
jgi:hypothetical protein